MKNHKRGCRLICKKHIRPTSEVHPKIWTKKFKFWRCIFDAKELYRCMQIVNGQKLDDTDMNVLIKEDESVEIQFLIGNTWKS